MTLIPPKSEEMQRDLPPTGTHRAVLYKLVNLGTLETEWQGKPKKSHKIRLIWELSDENIEYEKDGQKVTAPFAVGRKFTLSMGDNSHLYPIVQGITGGLTDDERWNFDVESLVGQPCLITVIHDEWEGKKFAKVTGATKLPKGMMEPKQVNESTIWDVRKLSKEEIADLPEYIAKDMESSDEYKLRFLAPRSEQPTKIGNTDMDYPDGPVDSFTEEEINPEDVPFNKEQSVSLNQTEVIDLNKI